MDRIVLKCSKLDIQIHYHMNVIYSLGGGDTQRHTNFADKRNLTFWGGTTLQYYCHYTILGFAIITIASIVYIIAINYDM